MPRLRQERRFNVLGKKRQRSGKPAVGIEYPVDLQKGDAYPLFVVADRMNGRSDEANIAEGTVQARKLGAQLFADRLVYWPVEDEVEATGKVRLLQEGTALDAPYLRMQMGSQIGVAKQADYYFFKEVPSKFYRPNQTVITVASSNATVAGAPMMLSIPNNYGLPTANPQARPSEAAGHAAHIDFEGENRMRLHQSTYSTCKPGRTDWYLQTRETFLDFDNQVGEARNATLVFEDVPIFYTPYANFSLNHQRHSGFLNPNFSMSTRNGLDLAMPYYWAIAPDYEATLIPRFMGKRGFQIGGEAQYLAHNYRGTTRAEFMPEDAIDKRERYAYNIQHQHNLGRGFSALVNWQGVSDDTYWQDMSSRLLQTSQTQLPRQLVLGYAPVPWLQTSTQLLRYQTLQPDPNNPIARPYFIEPQINVVGYKANVLHTDFSMIGQYSRFTHPDKTNGERFVFYPQLSLPVVHPAFQLTPKIGLHTTSYQLSQQAAADVAAGQPTQITRTLPVFSLDSTVVFERESQWLGRDYIQTLEPRLYYVNIPYKDQSRFPVFDSGLSDFNFAQIFAENRYTGQDRINDANQLTAGVTTRILDGDTGAERFKAMIGERYYFKPQRVALTGETVRQADFSNLVAAAQGLIAPKTYADTALEYNYRDGVSERFAAGLRFQPELGKVLSASYRYTRDPLTTRSVVDQIDIAGQWPLSGQWFAVGRYNWSLKDKQLLEAIGGFEYNAGCWAARAVIQRLEALTGTANMTFFLQLELIDFASIGSNPLGLLRRGIPGYGKTNELPDSSLFNSP